MSAEQNALLTRLRVNYETSDSTDHEIINSILQENSTLHEQMSVKSSQLDQLTAKCTQLEADLSEKEILRLKRKKNLKLKFRAYKQVSRLISRPRVPIRTDMQHTLQVLRMIKQLLYPLQHQVAHFLRVSFVALSLELQK